MIVAAFGLDERERISDFVLTGHAQSVESGNDPLCAAVSAMVTLVANTLIEVQHIGAEVQIGKSGQFTLRVPEPERDRAQEVLSGFLLQLRDYEAQYPKNLRVKTGK